MLSYFKDVSNVRDGNTISDDDCALLLINSQDITIGIHLPQAQKFLTLFAESVATDNEGIVRLFHNIEYHETHVPNRRSRK
jgi:hypothetical protein